MKKILFTLILITVCFSNLKSQTVTINHKVVRPSFRDTTSYVKFKINNQYFGEKDTIIQIRINDKEFDKCEAIMSDDTLKFYTKLKTNEIYEISQGCCCAVFNFQPLNNPRRGTIKLKNKTNRDLALIVAEANKDTVRANKILNLFSYESAMCLFKPCSILITETEYLSEKYDYTNDDRDYDSLWIEQEQYVLAIDWYQFLHGEKIELDYNDKTKKFDIKIIGYLTDEKYKEVYKKL